MNILEFNIPGGFPLTTRILNELQKAYKIFQALGFISGDFTIIAGCDPAGSNIGDGYVFLNGELLEFKGGPVQANVIVREDAEALVFENGNSNNVIKTRYATFGTGLTMYPWSDFERCGSTKELTEAVAELGTTVGTMQTKLSGIENGAQVNVQPDWTETDITKKSYIKNRGVGKFLRILTHGTGHVGNPSTDALITIDLDENIGTTQYYVFGSLVGKNVNSSLDNDVMWVIPKAGRTATSFQIAIREVAAAAQDLEFDYIIVAKNQ